MTYIRGIYTNRLPFRPDVIYYIDMEKTVTLTLKKKTLLEVYNQVNLLNNMGFPNFQKGEPVMNLMLEIKKEVKKNKKQEKVPTWKELLNFWPMTIVVPSLLLAILFGPYIMR